MPDRRIPEDRNSRRQEMSTRLLCVAVLLAGSLSGSAYSQTPADAQDADEPQSAAASPAPVVPQAPADVAEQIIKAPRGAEGTPADASGLGPEWTPDGSDPSRTVKAIWVAREVSFTYSSTTSLYYCDGLREKVKWVMKQLGVMDGYKVRIRSCFNSGGGEVSFGPILDPLSRAEHSPRVVIEAVVPQRVTPELLAQLSERQSERELIARVRGEATVVDNAEAQFAASTRQVTFDDGSRRGRIEPGDCELIEQMRDAVFVPLGFRIVEDKMACAPNRVMSGTVNLQVEVLEPWTPEPESDQTADPGAAQ
jgi:hypothetical protein